MKKLVKRTLKATAGFVVVGAFISLCPQAKAIPITGFSSLELRDYEVSLPAGNYVINVDASRGDADLMIFDDNADLLAVSESYGRDSLRGELSSGIYYVRVVMDSCYAFWGGCDADLVFSRNGEPYRPSLRLDHQAILNEGGSGSGNSQPSVSGCRDGHIFINGSYHSC